MRPVVNSDCKKINFINRTDFTFVFTYVHLYSLHADFYYRANTHTFHQGKNTLISTDKVIGIACDVTNEDDVTRTVQKAQQWMGKIDVLVNAAGVNVDTLLVKTERETIMHQLSTNLIGTMFTCKSVIKPMIRNRGGCIINMGKCFNLQYYSLRYREKNAQQQTRNDLIVE